MSGIIGGEGSRSGILKRYAEGALLKSHVFYQASDVALANDATMTTFKTFAYSPNGGNINQTSIYAWLHLWIDAFASDPSGGNTHKGRKTLQIIITGDDITNIDYTITETCGPYLYDTSDENRLRTPLRWMQGVPAVVLDGTGNADLTYTFKMANEVADAGVGWNVRGNNTFAESYVLVQEFQQSLAEN